MNRDEAEEIGHDVDCDCIQCRRQSAQESEERNRQRIINERRDAEDARHRVTLNWAGHKITFDDRDEDDF
jgi:hypothetical protein